MQEHDKDDRSQNYADQDRVAHAGNGIGDQLRLVVECFDLHSCRQHGADLFDFLMCFVSHFLGVAVGLAVDIEQYRRFSIGSDNRINRFHSRDHVRQIANPHRNSCRRDLHHDPCKLLGAVDLSADQSEHKLMVLLEQSRRVNQIGLLDRVENIGDRDTGSEQLRRIRLNVELRFLPALYHYRGNAIQAIQSRLELVRRHLPEPRLRYRLRRKAVANNRKAGEGHPPRINFRCRRQFRLHAGDRRIDVLQRLEHVYVPVEEKIYFRRAAAGS